MGKGSYLNFEYEDDSLNYFKKEQNKWDRFIKKIMS